MINSKTKTCTMLADQLDGLWTPEIQNRAYQAIGLEEKYVFTASQIREDSLENAVRAVRTLGIRGFSCTPGFVREVIAYLDQVEEVARRCGQVNAVVNDNGRLQGYNTTWLGCVIPIEIHMKLQGRKAAVLGTDELARMIAYGLQSKGADVTIYDRDTEAAARLAHDTHCRSEVLSKESVRSQEIIVNATPLGGISAENDIPVLPHYLDKHHLVFDTVAVPYETQLLKAAASRGARVIHGIDLLLYQESSQFELFTGIQAPIESMRQDLMDYFGMNPL